MINHKFINHSLRSLYQNIDEQTSINNTFMKIVKELDDNMSKTTLWYDSKAISSFNETFSMNNSVFYIDTNYTGEHMDGSILFPYNNLNLIGDIITNKETDLIFHLRGEFNVPFTIEGNKPFIRKFIGHNNMFNNSITNMNTGGQIIFENIDFNNTIAPATIRLDENSNTYLKNCTINTDKIGITTGGDINNIIIENCTINTIDNSALMFTHNVSNGIVRNNTIRCENNYSVFCNDTKNINIDIIKNIFEGNVFLGNVSMVYFNLFDNGKGISTKGNVQKNIN